MQIIPAVDLLGTDATRLEQGDFNRELFRTPAEAYVAAVAATQPPLIHLVDLEGARSGKARPEIIRNCVEAAGNIPLQVSGGIRSLETAEKILSIGASRVLIGTAAFRERSTLATFTDRLGEQLAVTLDVRDGRINIAGWLDQTTLNVEDALEHCERSGVVRILGTAIDRDGTMAGPDLELYELLCSSSLKVIAAGGVRDQADVDALEAVGCEAAVMGRAFAQRILATP
jgi:phosphoribosylformimino-5-aminoimidazole carboxamide ribotide isomerase